MTRRLRLVASSLALLFVLAAAQCAFAASAEEVQRLKEHLALQQKLIDELRATTEMLRADLAKQQAETAMLRQELAEREQRMQVIQARMAQVRQHYEQRVDELKRALDQAKVGADYGETLKGNPGANAGADPAERRKILNVNINHYRAVLEQTAARLRKLATTIRSRKLDPAEQERDRRFYAKYRENYAEQFDRLNRFRDEMRSLGGDPGPDAPTIDELGLGYVNTAPRHRLQPVPVAIGRDVVIEVVAWQRVPAGAAGDKMPPTDVLQVAFTVKNVSTDAITLKPPHLASARPTLTTDAGETLGSAVKPDRPMPEVQTPINPVELKVGHKVQGDLAFEMPKKGMEKATLVIPKAAWGGTGTLEITFPLKVDRD